MKSGDANHIMVTPRNNNVPLMPPVASSTASSPSPNSEPASYPRFPQEGNKSKAMPPIHPGETLWEDFLRPLGLTASRLAMELIVPVTRMNDIVRETRLITADTALRLARYFRTADA